MDSSIVIGGFERTFEESALEPPITILLMRITGVVISKKSKCAEQTAISKSLKTRQILYTLCAPCRKFWFELRLQ